jgi:hypothetical protein
MASEPRYYSDVTELDVVFSPEEANRKLDSGYELLKIETISTIQKLGDLSAQETTRLVFVLGRKKTIEKEKEKEGEIIRPSNVAKPNVASTTTTVPEILIPQSIPWKEQTSGFAWAFATRKDGSPIEEYRSFVERLKLSPLERDGYRYSISKDGKFLQRSKVEAKK